jgi:biotin-[acetyl-CoA-carboxylase] ligase/type 3 pantothenate kinase
VYVRHAGRANDELPLVQLSSVDSTNTHCLEALRNNKGLPAVAVWTDRQTAGRGRSGKSWTSVPGASLCLSVGFRLPTGFQPVEGFSVAVGVALVQVLRRFGANIDLKWPNDLIFQGRKLGGVLCEAVTSDQEQLWVAGVGINLVQIEVQANPHALLPANLAETGVNIEVAALAQALAQALMDVLSQANQPVFVGELLAQATTCDPWFGQAIQVFDQGVPTSLGISQGVDDKGQYLLQTPAGQLRLRHGELSLRKTVLKNGLLLIDVGNSRLKWAISDFSAQAPLSIAHVSSHDLSPQALETLKQQWRDAIRDAENIQVVLACVGKPEWVALIAAFAQHEQIAFQRVSSVTEYAGLKNSYEVPQSLGVDRFCGLLALTKCCPGQAAVLVSAGTATTIDAVDETGRFLGGMILPGVRMMQNALQKNTAQLPLADPEFSDFPVTTQQAIATGIRSAQLGAVSAMLGLLSARCGEQAVCVLTGGDASWLESGLNNARSVPDLVMQGLRWWALEKKTDGEQ